MILKGKNTYQTYTNSSLIKRYQNIPTWTNGSNEISPGQLPLTIPPWATALMKFLPDSSLLE